MTQLIYLSGGHSKAIHAQLPPTVGWMLQPGMGNRPSGDRLWAADTGRFASPEAYSDDEYLRWLDRHRRNSPGSAERCLFATAPDVVGDADATLALSVPMLRRLKAEGWAPALVAQDGLEDRFGEIPWDELDCLFTGGSTGWKISVAAWALAVEAQRRGKWTHLGRVNSRRRLRSAAVGGYRSADGTFLKYCPAKTIGQVLGWMDELRDRPVLSLPELPSARPGAEKTPPSGSFVRFAAGSATPTPSPA